MATIMKIDEAAEFLGVSDTSVRRWTNDGSLKCFRLNGSRRFFENDLEQFKEENLTHLLESDKLLSVDEAAKYLGVSKVTIRRWMKNKLKYVVPGYRRKVFFEKRVLDDFKNNLKGVQPCQEEEKSKA